MQLVNARMLTADVASLGLFYASLVGCEVVPNDYYVEIPTGGAIVAVSRRRFTELDGATGVAHDSAADRMILDFRVDDVDGERKRIAETLDVEWVMQPTNQPWGTRSMMFRDPDGNLINVFAPEGSAQ